MKIAKVSVPDLPGGPAHVCFAHMCRRFRQQYKVSAGLCDLKIMWLNLDQSGIVRNSAIDFCMIEADLMNFLLLLCSYI